MDHHKGNSDRHGVAMDSAILAQSLYLQGKIPESEASLDQAFQILDPNPAGELGIQMFVVRSQLHAREGLPRAARIGLDASYDAGAQSGGRQRGNGSPACHGGTRNEVPR
jgi:hypothetical protein